MHTERERFAIKLTSARRHTLHVIRSMHLQSDSIRLSFILRAILIARIDTEVKVCRHLWLYPSKQVCGLNTSTILANFRHFLDPSRFNKSGWSPSLCRSIQIPDSVSIFISRLCNFFLDIRPDSIHFTSKLK